jgi:hypothetical protein
MTRTTDFLRMIRQSLQIFFTDDLTFMVICVEMLYVLPLDYREKV